jgi:hypothetical protein
VDDESPPLGRLVELALLAPLGLALTLHERLPSELRRRRQAVENQVQLARMIGQFVVQQGRAEWSRQAASRSRSAETSPVAPSTVSVEPVEPTTQDLRDRRSPAPTQSGSPAPLGTLDSVTAGDLPISGYESLAAIHVVQRLGGLRPAELELVRRFESEHRGRRTVLSKIEQLQAGA